jgi:hypothetical protein
LGYNTHKYGKMTRKPMYSYLKQTEMSFMFFNKKWRTEGQKRSYLGVWYQCVCWGGCGGKDVGG